MYDTFEPSLPLGLPFSRMAVSPGWADWPAMPELFPMYFPGVQTSRDTFLLDVDSEPLERRMAEYLNPNISHEEIARRYPSVMNSTTYFKAIPVRDAFLQRGKSGDAGIVRFDYRPFDTRLLYWDAQYGLLNRPRAEYKSHLIEGNLWLSAAQHLRKGETETQAYFTHNLASYHLIERGALWFPAWLHDEGLALDGGGAQRRPNLADAAQRYLDRLGVGVEDLFHHTLAVLHDPAYRTANAGALKMEWPRIPLPGWPEGGAPSAAEELAASAGQGPGTRRTP